MHSKIFFGTAIAMAIFLSACGDTITETTDVVGMKIIEEGDELPECSDDNEGAMAYLTDSASVYYCVGKKWTTLNGENGRDGEDGQDGKKGDTGDKGKKGDTGETGKAGDYCTTKALSDSSGYEILCDGDSVGVVLNGTQGDKGDKGDKGAEGAAGDTCIAEILPDGSGYKVVCGGDSVATVLNGRNGEHGTECTLAEGDNGVDTLKCGSGSNFASTIVYKAMCGGKTYDPTKQFCDERDNQIYRFVTIGTQTWMAQNMNYKTTYSRCYNFDKTNCETDGSLYYVDDSLKVCPSGWHLPDTSEYRILINTAGGESIAGKMLKSSSGWLTTNDKDGSGTDAYGFSIIPAGKFIGSIGGQQNASGKNSKAYLWTRSQGEGEYEHMDHYSLQLSSDSDSAIIVREENEGSQHSCFMSVRCIKD